jgi:hypothetical protein
MFSFVGVIAIGVHEDSPGTIVALCTQRAKWSSSFAKMKIALFLALVLFAGTLAQDAPDPSQPEQDQPSNPNDPELAAVPQQPVNVSSLPSVIGNITINEATNCTNQCVALFTVEAGDNITEISDRYVFRLRVWSRYRSANLAPLSQF